MLVVYDEVIGGLLYLVVYAEIIGGVLCLVVYVEVIGGLLYSQLLGVVLCCVQCGCYSVLCATWVLF